MRKLLFLFVALLATTALWAQRFQVGDLYYQVANNNDEMIIPYVDNPGYGYTTVVLYVPENTPAGCYAVGTVNGWDSNNTDLMFTPVEGATNERWVACTFEFAYDMQVKVLALPSDPSVAPGWSYQWGKNMDPENDLEEDNVVILQGAGYLELENQGQPKLTKLGDGEVTYIHVKAWATTPVIEAKPLEEAWIKHPWNGGDWTYQQMTKTADATFEYNCRYGANCVNIAGDANGGGENWYPGDQITIVDGAELATGDSVKFVFVSEKGTVGKVTVTLIEKGYPGNDEPDEAKDITVKAKVPATWTRTITAWVWPTGGDGKEVVPTKEGDWYVVTENCAELNIIFKNGEGWSGDANQTVEITGIKEDACFQLEQEGYSKATYTIVDCLQPIPDGPTSGTENGYDWVDLGLPSGLKWATMNVGATSDKDYGEWYNWGDIQAKTHFSWSTYKWYDTNYTINWGEFYFYAINKYTLDDGWHRGRWYEEQTTTKVVEGVTTYETTYVFTGDNKRVLEPEDDVATVKWGGTWRMPSKAECQELVDNCRWIYGSVDGVMGTKIIGPNGQSIFIPAAGFADPDGTYQVGTGAAFWSNELAYSTGSAYYVHCGNGNVSCDDYYRVRGYSVRPVCMPTTVEDENLSEVSCSDNTTQAKTNASDIDADYEPKAFAYVTYQTEDQDNYASLTEATIPSQIEHNGTIYDVVGIKENAFANSKSLTSVSIPESIATIETKAFYNCSGLTSVTIPSSVTSIGNDAFSGCSSLTSIAIPNSITSIGYSAFSGCSSLTSITIPNSITEINSGIFAYCSSLTSIVIPNSVTSIGSWTFAGCSSLSTINMPNKLQNIGNGAFAECSALTAITIPNTVTSMGGETFVDCSSLEYLSIPNSVKFSEIYEEDDHTWIEYSYGFDCIINCDNLKTLIVPADFFGVDLEDYYEGDYMESLAYLPRQLESLTINGGNMTHPFGWDFMIQNRKSLKHIDFGATESSIAEEAFTNFYNLESLVLPSQLETVPYMAVAECVKLKSISIPATVTAIEDRAFENCRMLSSVAFAENGALTRIGNWAFYNNHELTNLVIPEGVTEVGHAAFYGCTYLKEMTLPSTVQDIADNGFALCAKLRRMNVNATTPPQVEARTFEDVDRTIPVVVPDESVSVYKSAPVWQEFNIVGKSGVPAALDNIPAENSATRKLLRDGNLVIIRDGVEYNVMGQEL